MLKTFVLAALIFSTPLVAETRVLAFSGSTRAESINKALVNQAAEMARQMGASVKIIDLRDYPMPFYDADIEQQGMPQNAQRLRKLMMESQAMIIATPEYNGSVSGILKNVLDWASRSEEGKPSRAAFQGKKIALLSASPGAGGGSRALAHLKTIIQDIGGEVVATQVAVPNSYTAFDEKGQLKDSVLRNQLKQEIQQLLTNPSTR